MSDEKMLWKAIARGSTVLREAEDRIADALTHIAQVRRSVEWCEHYPYQIDDTCEMCAASVGFNELRAILLGLNTFDVETCEDVAQAEAK